MVVIYHHYKGFPPFPEIHSWLLRYDDLTETVQKISILQPTYIND